MIVVLQEQISFIKMKEAVLDREIKLKYAYESHLTIHIHFGLKLRLSLG